jgi:hypothetical protein
VPFALLLLVLAANPAEPKMKISLGKLSATEAKAAVSKTAAAQLEPLKGCYDLALKSAPDLKGELAVRFALERGAENPEAVSVDEVSTLKDDTVSQCVMARLRSTKWPKPKARSEVALTLKFETRR